MAGQVLGADAATAAEAEVEAEAAGADMLAAAPTQAGQAQV